MRSHEHFRDIHQPVDVICHARFAAAVRTTPEAQALGQMDTDHGEESLQHTTGQKRHDHQEQHLERMAAGVAVDIAQQPFDVADDAMDEARARARPSRRRRREHRRAGAARTTAPAHAEDGRRRRTRMVG